MSIINFIHKSSDKPADGTDQRSPQLISEEKDLNSVNDEFNQYLEYYMDQIRMKSKGCVLVVEDDIFCRMIIENAIKEYSHDIKIITASSEEEALSVLKNTPCDLVVSDYFLEGPGTGLDLCRKVISMYPKTKCLMMSSMNFPQYQEVVAKTDASPEFMESALPITVY